MNVRLTQIDGALPNIALMKLSHWFKSQGCTVTLTRLVKKLLSGQCAGDQQGLYHSNNLLAFKWRMNELLYPRLTRLVAWWRFGRCIAFGIGSKPDIR